MEVKAMRRQVRPATKLRAERKSQMARRSRRPRSAKMIPEVTMPVAVPLEAETAAMSAAAIVTAAEVTALGQGETPPGKAREVAEERTAENRLAEAVAVIRMTAGHAVAATVAVAAAVR